MFLWCSGDMVIMMMGERVRDGIFFVFAKWKSNV
jgi:hypothetical protein